MADALKEAKVPVLVGGHARTARPTTTTPTTPPTPTRRGCTRRASRSRSAPRAAGPTAATAGAEPPLRGRHRRRLRPARGRGPQGRHARPRRRSSASPTRSARSRPASAPTSSSPPATSSSRRPRCSRSSSTASRGAREPPHPALRASIFAGSSEVRAGTAPLGLDRPAASQARVPRRAAASSARAAERHRARRHASVTDSGRPRLRPSSIRAGPVSRQAIETAASQLAAGGCHAAID